MSAYHFKFNFLLGVHMKKVFLTVLVASACSVAASSAFAIELPSTSTAVSGGTINFEGRVVDAACSIAADSMDQTVVLSQVRTAKLSTAGETAGQKTPFSIQLEDCDTTVSTNASIVFNGSQDSDLAGSLANLAGAGSASNVALKLYDSEGNELAVGDQSAAAELIDGSNTIPFSVDYVATKEAATAGKVSATATFNVIYS